MELTDLISVNVDKIGQPRTNTLCGIPGIINVMQSEWDSLMMEIYTLKENLLQTREELSHSLYQQEASCNVIARLIKERDEARASLSNVIENLQSAKINKTEEKKEEPQIDEVATLVKTINVEFASLSSERKKRKTPKELAKPKEMGSFKVKSQAKLHNQQITFMDFQCSTNRLLTSSKDGSMVLLPLDKAEDKMLYNGHSGTTKACAFYSQNYALSCSSDCTSLLWNLENCSNPVKKYTFDSPLTSLALLSISNYAIYGLKSGSWAITNLESANTLLNVKACEPSAHLKCLKIHPDGLMLATGDSSGALCIWDVRNQKKLFSLVSEHKKVKDICFSERGVHLATCGGDDGVIKIWDLRYLNNGPANSIMTGTVCAKSVMFDYCGQYLGIVGDGVEILAYKDWRKVAFYENETKFRAMRFMNNANGLVAAASDGVKTYEKVEDKAQPE